MTPLQLVTVLLATSMVLLLVQIVYLLPNWRKKIVQAFLVVMYGSLIWIGGYLLELNAGCVEGMLFWSDFEFIGQPFIFYGLLLFVLHLTHTETKRVRMVALIWLIPPLLINLTVWIPALYPLLRVAPNLNTDGPLLTLNQSYGVIMYALYYPYIYTTFLVCLVLIAKQWRKLGRLFLKQTRGVIAAIILMMLSDLFYVLGLQIYPGFNHSSVIIVPVSLLTLFYMGRYYLLDVVPLAKSHVFMEMDDGLIITDPQMRILDANTMARQWFPALKTSDTDDLLTVFNDYPDLQHWFQSPSENILCNLNNGTKIFVRKKILRDPVQHISIGDIFLFTNISHLNDLMSLFGDTLKSQEQLSSRIATDLHDDFLSWFTVKYQNLESSLRDDPQIEAIYTRTVQKMRGVINDLYNFGVELGLYSALNVLVDGFNRSDEHRFFLSIPYCDERYNAEVETHIYRIVQQACRNALQHSQAETIVIDGMLEPERISLVIADDGVGMPVDDETNTVAQGHCGIANMRERANLIGASFEIISAPGEGVEINLAWDADQIHRREYFT